MIRLEKRVQDQITVCTYHMKRETAWRRVDVFIPVWNIVLNLKLHVERFVMI